MDRRTKNRIARMSPAELADYMRTIRMQLERAEAKHDRLSFELAHTRDEEQLRIKRARFQRLTEEMETLREILDWAAKQR